MITVTPAFYSDIVQIGEGVAEPASERSPRLHSFNAIVHKKERTPKLIMFFLHEKMQFDAFCDEDTSHVGLDLKGRSSLFVVATVNKAAPWVEFAARASVDQGVTIAVLVPVRTDTEWFHRCVLNNPFSECLFIEGRIKMDNKREREREPMVVVIFHPKSLVAGTSYKCESCVRNGTGLVASAPAYALKSFTS